MNDAIAWLGIRELGRRFRCGELNPVELAEHLLDRIDTLDGTLGAFVQLSRDRALAEARAAQDAFERGEDRGPLQGIPYAVKDVFDVAGLATGVGTRLLEGTAASADAEVVARLSAAGMVLLGKTHTVPLACTVVGINHELGTPRNPWREDPFVPGGSSSGSAVAVAAGLAPVALGSDTGGSVRTPAALCGITGLKTTVGSVSRSGMRLLSHSLDSIGPLTRSADDAAMVLSAMSEPRGGDPLFDPEPSSLSPMRVAVADSVLFDDVDPEVESAVRRAAAVLARLGARVERRAIPELDEAHALPGKFRCITAEGYAAYRELLEAHRGQLDPVTAWLEEGASVTPRELESLHRARNALQSAMAERWRDFDVVIGPTTARAAVSVAEAEARSREVARAYVRNTYLGNLLDLCGVSVPSGFTSDALPIGMMIYGPPSGELRVLRVARAFQGATSWHQRHPPFVRKSSSGGLS